MTSFAQTNEAYWAEYDGLQAAKHAFLTRYLDGWFPILTSWNGSVIYLECHAGCGRHLTGQPGSPILAIDRLLRHKLRPRILSSSQVHFVFFENHDRNCAALRAEVVALGELPAGMSVEIEESDYETFLRGVCQKLNERNAQLKPTLAFIDPFGFRLPMDLLKQLVSYDKVELIITFMYRHVDMAIHNPAQAGNMDRLFGCQDWRGLLGIPDSDLRIQETITLFYRQLGARYLTRMYMRGSNNALKYVLLHATGHPKGRDLAKEAVWATTPDGSFTAFERDNQDQPVLITADPNLNPLRERLLGRFSGQTVRMSSLYEWLHDEPWVNKHLHEVLRGCRGQGEVTFSAYEGKFAFGKNPRASFSPLAGERHRL